MWFASWDTLGSLEEHKSPLSMRMGNGERFKQDDIDLWLDAENEKIYEHTWTRGDLLVFCNYRFAHGRPKPKFRNSLGRNLVVFMGPSTDRAAI